MPGAAGRRGQASRISRQITAREPNYSGDENAGPVLLAGEQTQAKRPKRGPAQNGNNPGPAARSDGWRLRAGATRCPERRNSGCRTADGPGPLAATVSRCARAMCPLPDCANGGTTAAGAPGAGADGAGGAAARGRAGGRQRRWEAGPTPG